ncbi:MAG: hypothetical protein KTR31_22065 [Myxococcales bacterium]|nr:hypothetical protein [Myxococcales bacterium]
MIWLLAAAALATCPSGSDDVSQLVGYAESAFRDLDAPTFLDATDRVAEGVSCLTEPLSLELLHRLHRLQGLRAFVDGDERRAAGAFASARAVRPDLPLPAELVPGGHPLTTLYQLQGPAAGGSRAWPVPAEGELFVDGSRSLDLPSLRPSVVQLQRGDGAVEMSGYVWPDMPPLPYAVKRSGRRVRKGMLVVSGLSLASSAGLWLASRRFHTQYFEEEEDLERLDRLRLGANTATYGVVGAGTLGLTFGVVGLVGRRR